MIWSNSTQQVVAIVPSVPVGCIVAMTPGMLQAQTVDDDLLIREGDFLGSVNRW